MFDTHADTSIDTAPLIPTPEGQEHRGSVSRRSPSFLGYKGFKPLVAYCFGLNYILGVGFLTLPWAFMQAGYMLTILSLLVISGLALLSSWWIVEACSRAEAIVSDKEHTMEKPIFKITQRRFELGDLLNLFIGPSARVVYMLGLSMYMYGSLWSYTSVFSSSISAHLGLPFINGGHSCDVVNDLSDGCQGLYKAYVFVFAIFVIPVACLDLTEQVILQVTLALFRFVCFIIIMATSAVGIASGTGMAPSAEPFRSPAAFDFNGFHLMVPVLVYAQIFHHSIPCLTQPVLKKEQNMKRIMTWLFSTTTVLYCVLGLLVSFFLGAAVKPTCTLNWDNYTGGQADSTWWAQSISYLIVIFPAIDILSTYPLNAITLGENLYAVAPIPADLKSQRKVKILFRLLAAVPPIIGGLFVKDLAVIIDWTGLVGLFICFVSPAALLFFAVKATRARWGEAGGWHASPYSSPFSNQWVVIAVGGLTAALVVFLFAFLVQG
eukprot:GILK01002414.1.p1 GENE.GILK01002414.1~~GILK01002414.1.p1  ORF type:complete len:492 (+),score=56.59 GILK01002414.1:106-1581(+)